MSEKNILISLIPRIYHQTPTQSAPLLEILDRNRQRTEKMIEEITLLGNVDACPDEYLPYLASLTNVPLWGETPQLWRKQIRNWPYICRLKGTKKAISYFMDAIGSTRHGISTYWRDRTGKFVVQKPVGNPYLDESSGLWLNSKTHYFSIQMSLDEDYYRWTESFRSIQERVIEWLKFVKPFHAELLRFEWITEPYDHQNTIEEEITSYKVTPTLYDVFQWGKSHYGDGRHYGQGNRYGIGTNEEFDVSQFWFSLGDSFFDVIRYGKETLVGEHALIGGTVDRSTKENVELKIYKNGVGVADV